MTKRKSSAAITTTAFDGVVTRTRTHTHQAKDRLFYRTYEAMAKANKRHNEQRMKDLGLDTYKPKKAVAVTPSPKKRPRIDATATTTPEPTRRSRRVAKEPALPVQDLITDLVRPVKKPDKPVRRPVTPEYDVISTDNLEKLGKNYPDAKTWMASMEEYLIEQEQLSTQNHRSVMRQVGKLCSGDGVTYHRWKEGIVFAKGLRLNLSCNMHDLYEQACEYENEYGRDLGNGWLLRHPIKKIHNFQHYLLEQDNDGDDEKTKE